ncbi:MAG TPA: nitrate reductase molybdenum cofactor assembly chaperone [Solirubrobacterales bacterium]|nr:nitrate reductase molybdenum cofactor assembly chaperone [Solirubrobacterales bacterium]
MIGRQGRDEDSALVYKLCSLLLQYPDEELLEGREEIAAALAELPSSPAAAALKRFVAWWSQHDPGDLAAHYVETIDLNKRSGLYLTFYSDGDKRERGSALVRLKRLYRAAGLPLEGTELPDYLPVMLEFAAAAPAGRGELVLREHRASLELVRLSLRDLGSPYADLLDAVCETLGAASAAERARVGVLAAAGPPQELVGLEPFAPPEVMPGAEARR